MYTLPFCSSIVVFRDSKYLSTTIFIKINLGDADKFNRRVFSSYFWDFWQVIYYLFEIFQNELARASSITLRRIGSTLGALRLCCTNSMANRYKLRYQCISTLTGGTGTSGIGTF